MRRSGVIRRFFLHDELRLFEILSACNLLIWALAAPGYGLGPDFQAALALVGLGQFGAMAARHFHIAYLRFPAMALAAGMWTALAYCLGKPDLITTALAAGFSGVWLAWKHTSSRF